MNKELIKRLREYFALPEASDEEILELTKNTLGRASIELNLAFEILRNEIIKSFRVPKNLLGRGRP